MPGKRVAYLLAVVGDLRAEITEEAAPQIIGAPERRDPVVEVGFQPGQGSGLAVAEEVPQLHLAALGIEVDHLSPECLLAGEVGIERSFGNIRSFDDALDPAGGITFSVNHPQA